jgi:hypothetical protein
MVRFVAISTAVLALAQPAAAALESGNSIAAGLRPAPKTWTIAALRDPVWLRSHPGGARIASIGTTTEFGSPQRLAVVGRDGKWLQVTSSDLPNHRFGWMRMGRARVTSTPFSLTIDLSSKLLLLKKHGSVKRTMRIGVGRAGSPTPTGRFGITDKLAGARYGPYYGCCILALSAHQPSLPSGWTGGDRIAIHGTNAPSTIGAAASAGCLHARDADLRLLMRRLPLGARVTIHA